MKKSSPYYSLLFGIAFLIIGIIAKQPLIMILFGTGPIIIFIILLTMDNKEKKLIKKDEERRQFDHSTKYVLSLENDKESSHFLCMKSGDNQPYEVWYKKIQTMSKPVTVFEKPPRKITFNEFIELADAKYPGLGVLYNGINENNWESYIDALSFWQKNSKDKKSLNQEHLKLLSNRSVFKCKKYPVSGNPETGALVSISEFLFAKGFVFKEAYAGGGVNEISHTGDKAYSSRYTDFEEFRNNFHSDFTQAYRTEKQHYGVWLSSLNYSYVYVLLEKDGLTVNIISKGYSYEIEWGKASKHFVSLKEETDNAMLKILGNNFYLSKYN